jgi:hypothetical protein
VLGIRTSNELTLSFTSAQEQSATIRLRVPQAQQNCGKAKTFSLEDPQSPCGALLAFNGNSADPH